MCEWIKVLLTAILLAGIVLIPLPGKGACVGCGMSVGCPSGSCCICCGSIHSEVTCCPINTYGHCSISFGWASCSCNPGG